MPGNNLHIHKTVRHSIETILYLSIPILVFFAVLAMMLGKEH